MVILARYYERGMHNQRRVCCRVTAVAWHVARGMIEDVTVSI